MHINLMGTNRFNISTEYGAFNDGFVLGEILKGSDGALNISNSAGGVWQKCLDIWLERWRIKTAIKF